jgi:hypothetical protein
LHGRRCWSRGSITRTDYGKYATNFNGFVFLNQDLLNNAREGRWDFGIDLVG